MLNYMENVTSTEFWSNHPFFVRFINGKNKITVPVLICIVFEMFSILLAIIIIFSWVSFYQFLCPLIIVSSVFAPTNQGFCIKQIAKYVFLLILCFPACCFLTIAFFFNSYFIIQVILYTTIGFIINTNDAIAMAIKIVVGAFYFIYPFKQMQNKYNKLKYLVFKKVKKYVSDHGNANIELDYQVLPRHPSDRVEYEAVGQTDTESAHTPTHVQLLSTTQNGHFDRIPKQIWVYMYNEFLPVPKELAITLATLIAQGFGLLMVWLIIQEFNLNDNIECIVKTVTGGAALLIPSLVTQLLTDNTHSAKIDEANHKKLVQKKLVDYIEKCKRNLTSNENSNPQNLNL